MKIYKTTVYPSQQDLYELLCASVDQKFADKVKSDIKLAITESDHGIEIGQPHIYETYLYMIKIKGSDVLVSKSEHYIDDIYSLALEDIIDSIIVEYLGVKHIETILQP
jgi:flavorubredoxin